MMRRASTSGRQATAVPGALQRDPFVHQRARIGAGDAGFGGAQMAQPAEAEQSRSAHSSDGGVDLERRAAVADHDLAGEGEAAGIDFAGAGRVGGAQVLRRDQQPVGLAGEKRQRTSGCAVEPARRRVRNARRARRRRTTWCDPRPTRATLTRSTPSAGVSRVAAATR